MSIYISESRLKLTVFSEPIIPFLFYNIEAPKTALMSRIKIPLLFKRNTLQIIKPFQFLCLTIFFFASCIDSTKELERKNQEKKENYEASIQEDSRVLSLNVLLLNANAKFKHKDFSEGIIFLDSAVHIANNLEKFDIIFQRADAYFELRDYDKAIADYTELIEANSNNKSGFYKRAICYNKQGKIQESVNDLKESIALGNQDAEIMHNKINPIKKRVSYYITRCCDGTTSNATGRGACSHHDGVCDWNEPVYEEYRKY